jgi:hypothetical protein
MSSTLIPLLLAAWVAAVVLFVYVESMGRFLWIEVVLALAGVFGAILPLVISPYTAFLINATTLILFIVSLQVFQARPAGSHVFHEKFGLGPEASVVQDRGIHRSHS